MNSQDQYEMDSALQRSLQQLQAQDDSNESNQQMSQQGSDVNQDDQDQNDEEDPQQADEKPKEDKNSNKKKADKEKQEHRDYYAEYLKPDEDVDTEPPFIVVVQGSPSSGKSSVIRSLIKHFTKNKVQNIVGPITLRSNKKQRITIIECPNDLTAMIDLSKIADVVILLIDASLGFQMQTFQFLSLIKGHGFPHIIGVLTHLDFYKENKQLRKAKKKLKKRFQYQVGGNYKLISLSKWESGTYTKIQVSMIARYMLNTKCPIIPWRNSHPYIMADRWQTVQDKQYQSKDKLDVAFYGYIRGGSYRLNGKVHIVGVGDFEIDRIQPIDDPCPEFKKNQQQEQNEEQKTKGNMKGQGKDSEDDQSLDQKPSKKEVQVTKKKKKRRTLNQSQRIIYAPACNLGTLNFEHTSGFVTIPHEYVKFTKMNQDEQQRQIEQGVKLVRDLQKVKRSINERLNNRETEFELFDGVKIDQSESNQNQQGIKRPSKQENDEQKFLTKKTELRQIQRDTQNMLVNFNNDDEVHRKYDIFQLIYESKEKMVTYDCSKYDCQATQVPEDLKSLFVTGMQGDALNQMDVESGEDIQEKRQQQIIEPNYVKAKLSQRTNFYQKGAYVRIVVSGIAFETFSKLNYNKPLLLTRINLGEDNFGFIKVKFKRHRWYNNLLKSNDPLVVSSGWRRYQSLTVFATEDRNERLRYLKYTPQHDFCTAIFYGNFNQQNNGCVFTQTLANNIKKFRIAGSGLVMEINKSFEVMKKIKLIGEPYKIMKNTAFVKGMFNSVLQVSNYIGGKVRTVSGIRGQIKKTCKQGGPGTFRATFEDKILMSDIVFCRAWYRIKLERFCNPILSFQKNRLMKTTYELRIQNGAQIPKKKDSEYKQIDRAPKTFAPFMIPKKLEAKLPFKSAQKLTQSKKDRIRRAESQSIPKILLSDKDREIASLIQRLNTIKHHKMQKRETKEKEKARLREARQKPKQEYYEMLKKQQKSQKMASIMRKKNRDNKNRKQED